MAEPDIGGTEGPRGHEVRQPVDDAAVPWRVFAAVGLFGLLLAVIYWFTSYEEAGSALLAVAGVLSLWCGVYLWLQHRPPRAAPADARTAGRPAEPAGTAGYLPHASVWPFVIGVGAATVLNGLVLGTWVILPGALLLVLGLGGFVAQTRRRD